jgi:P27 family predicted phage terminase small subunit
MTRGRKPKPEVLKKRQGNPGKRAIVKEALAPSPSGPAIDEPPIKLEPDARRIWDAQMPLLRARNYVQATDLRTFARYCKFLALFEGVAPLVTVKNIVKQTKSEFVTMDRLNKHFLAMLHLDKRLETMEANFGLNPAARQSLLMRRAAGADPQRLPLEDPNKPRVPAQDQQATAPIPAPEHRLPSPIGQGRLN